MSEKDTARNVIESYRKRQQRAPFLIGGLAVVLVIAGILILAIWISRGNSLPLAFLASATPTATETVTNTPVPPTATATMVPPTPTETATPTLTITVTPSEPFLYVVQEGDTCSSIATQFNADLDTMLEINSLDADCLILIGEELVIPPPGDQLATATPIPEGFFGTIEYRVKGGDTLRQIALDFNSTVEAILDENEDIENENEISAGQVILVPVNIVTPVPTDTPGAAEATPGTVMTFTPSPSDTPTP